MGNTLNLRSALQTKLATLVTDTTYQKAKQNATGIWCIYDFDQVTDNENLTQYRLVLDVMHKQASTTDIEDKADEIWTALDHWYYRDSNIAFTTYCDLRSPVREEDTLLNHRRLTFILKLYK